MITNAFMGKAILVTSSLFLGLSMYTTPVAAQESQKTNPVEYAVSIELYTPDQDVLTTIKTSMIEEYAEKTQGFDIENIDLDASTITLNNAVDVSSVHTESVIATIQLKVKASEYPIIKTSIDGVVTVSVEDNTAPVITMNTSSIVLPVDSEFDPWEYLDYAFDNSYVYPNVSFDNDVDTSTVGTYTLTAIATDASGNRTTVETPVRVGLSYGPFGGNVVTYSDDDILYMLELINQQRAAAGLNPYELGSDAAQAAAAVRAQEAAQICSHTRPDGSHYRTAFDEFGVPYGNDNWPMEILTYAGTTVESHLDWWMNSPGHRATILLPNYTHIALGYCNDMWVGIAY